jgi:transposase
VSPPIAVQIDGAKLEALLGRVKVALPDDYESVKGMADTIRYLYEYIQKKNASIGRLLTILFGPKTEKTSDVLTDDGQLEPTADDTPEPEADQDVATKRRKGHGRKKGDDYTGAQRIHYPHETLKPGDVCPCCSKGKVYGTEPGIFVLLRGSAPVTGEVIESQKLRCNGCGEVFTAKLPDGVGKEKYDATAGSMMAVMKYGTGMPLYRLAKLQESLGIPLPASTIWEVLVKTAEPGHPVLRELVRLAAQGGVIFTDDTAMKILELPEGLAHKSNDGAEDEEDEEDERSERTGVFTSAIVSEVDGHRIALFFTGTNHAGENMDRLLAEREKDRDPPMEMCDGLSRNRPKDHDVTLVNCLVHGRRQFVDIVKNFPTECRFVIECLRAVYKIEAKAKGLGLSPEERLRFHQEHSALIMDALSVWFEWKIEDRLVEPNSGLGDAIKYMRKRWEQMTFFLRKAGAPLDNNTAERVLKMVILHRKNAYFYLTENGARIGDLFMSLIHTCRLSGANPFKYLTALQQNAERVRACPGDWLPWNYECALGTVNTS